MTFPSDLTAESTVDDSIYIENVFLVRCFVDEKRVCFVFFDVVHTHTQAWLEVGEKKYRYEPPLPSPFLSPFPLPPHAVFR